MYHDVIRDLWTMDDDVPDIINGVPTHGRSPSETWPVMPRKS